MHTRDRLGWLLSGILIGIIFMASCDMSDSSPTTRPTTADAAQSRPLPTSIEQLPPDAPPDAPQRLPSGQGGADAYSDTVAAVFAKGNPSVVRIDVSSGQGESLGTGFVVDTEGHIVTNYHVIAGSSDGAVIVQFVDGEAEVGDVIGFDQDADLAVVKIRNPNSSILFPVELGDSSALRVGDMVLAIGNPFGENRTATAGIISAVRASKSEGGSSVFSIPGVLQTDAAINPGNSGGPLFNSRGQVVGVNTFILDPSGRGANIGIGYAVPINLVKRIAPALIANGSYTHPLIGAELAAVNSLAARQNNLPSKGVLVAKLYEGPAANAGIRQGDVIVAVNGQAILEPGDLISFLEFNTTPGDTITISIAEEGGGTRDVQVQVGARPGR